MSTPPLEDLYPRLGHHFADPELLLEALCHPSLDRRRQGGSDYQRLEFLGDRVLGLTIATTLYRGHPDADEGDLAVRFNGLVRRDTVAAAARKLDLGPFIRLGKSEARQGGREKPAILADVCEAVIGALYLDGGLAAAEAFVARYWADFLADSRRAAKDAKTSLQELVQGAAGKPPRYRVVEQTGPDHAPHFTVEVLIEGAEPVIGEGRSRREAEQAAAEILLDHLRDQPGAGHG
ncbi:MAG: ribonuclease III [Alphaproteobacteria bacterium]|nr:ribonuclease III [Alphaproteobacteria bacterium]MDP6563496.1 ribonuclease III [Alphaproteobacteria bacterium]MDP6812682.1 ribonuclease III [Alphaproteobacteria bacterium]